MTAADGKLYVFGGYNNQNVVTANSWKYDPELDSWEAVEPMPTPQHSTSAVSIGDTLFVIGGDASKPITEATQTEKPTKINRGYVVQK